MSHPTVQQKWRAANPQRGLYKHMLIMYATQAMTSARLLDQFYTKPALAKELVEHLHAYLRHHPLPLITDPSTQCAWLEPSAGAGAFVGHMPSATLALDLDPQGPGITKQNFLTFTPPQHTPSKPWIVVGNPPFGKNASKAVQFFNHAASFATVIAMIVPRTFEKTSAQKRLDPHFSLAEEHAIPAQSFTFQNEDVAVPCVFQIWSKLPPGQQRPTLKLPTQHPDWSRVPTATKADFAFQRVGAAAGKIKNTNATALSPPSHHFIKVNDRTQVAKVRKIFEAIDFTTVKHKTAGNPSISLTELVALYSAQKAITP